MFKNIVTRDITDKYFRLHRVEVKLLDFLNEKNMKEYRKTNDKHASLIYSFLTWK